MNRIQTGYGALAIVSVLAACADDPVGQRATRSENASHSQSAAAGGSGTPLVEVLDACDPTDPGWASTGGCVLNAGSVSSAEFRAELTSPLSSAVTGHQAWRNEPSFLTIAEGEIVRVKNEGGRVHTFTRVANFGGGRVAPLNVGLTPAPECDPGAGPPNLRPDDVQEIAGLTPGTHRFQCCFHPWMRAHIEVH